LLALRGQAEEFPVRVCLSSLFCAFSLVTIGACQPPLSEEPEASSQESTLGGTYLLQPVHSGKCVDVDGQSTLSGANVLQWGCDGRASQKWVLRDLGSDSYEVKSFAGLCLDVSGASLLDGGNVIQWTCKQSNNQKWQLVADSGAFRLKALHSGKCLDVAGASTANGANVQQWSCVNVNQQRFKIVPLGTSKLFVPAASVTASANDGNVPANTVDGSLATRWSAAGDGQWIQYDLGLFRRVTRVRLAGYSGASRSFRFDVQTSTDGITWLTAAAGLTTALTDALQSFDLSPVDPARYVRLVGHGNSSSTWNSYTEVEIWGGVSTVPACQPETDATFCARLGKNCGTVSGADNCGQSRTVTSCGTCTAPATCGGSGTPNVCSCAPESNAAFCSRLGKSCGTVTGTDNCGQSRTVSSCGTCTAPATCGGGGTPNVCAVPAPVDDLPACRRTVPVTTSAALASAIGAALAGDCIVLADGSYTLPTIRAQGTAASPIVIKAAHPLQATVSTGTLSYDGAAYVVVQGLLWQAGQIRMNNCDHCRLSRCRLALAEPTGVDFDWVTVTGTSNGCRLDHNDLGPKNVLGNMVMLAGSGSQIVQNTRIDHNFFHDVNRTSGNGWETIRGGLSGWTFSSAHSVIEHNLFKAASGDPETTSIKS
jgi:poly(beta-D-mannuronate) lyase